LSVVPNPNDGSFTVSLNEFNAKDFSLQITNSLGQSIYKSQGAKGNGQININLNKENISDGIYFVQLISVDNIVSRKVMVQK